jgi:hypothetical protein
MERGIRRNGRREFGADEEMRRISQAGIENREAEKPLAVLQAGAKR